MQYGQAYTNPYATGSSPDANQAALAAALSKLGQEAGGTTAGSTLSVSPVNGASLKNLGSTNPVAESPTAAISALGGTSALNTAGASQAGGIAGSLGTFGKGIEGLAGLANMYLGFQAQKLAKKNFKFQVGAYNNNLQNTVQTYNTSLEDRINSRHHTEGRSAADTSAYLDKNRLSANTLG